MALDTRTVYITADWTLVTSKAATIQFNDSMYMLVTNSNTSPNEELGFFVEKNDYYINSDLTSYVWAKSKLGGTNLESVRVIEDI